MCLMRHLNRTNSSYSGHDKPKPTAASRQASMAIKFRTNGSLLLSAHDTISSWGSGRTVPSVLSANKQGCIFMKHPFSSFLW